MSFSAPFDNIGHGKGFAGTCDAEQDLMLFPGQDPRCQLLNGLALVTTGFEGSFEFERGHIGYLSMSADRITSS